MKSIFSRCCKLLLITGAVCWGPISESHAGPLKIMPVGDSITRGSYIVYTGLPNKKGAGWRKPLQDKLRKIGLSYEFVGELDYCSYGDKGIVAPNFSPNHHGLAGFSCKGILKGGIVPTPRDALRKKGVKQIRVPGIIKSIKRNNPEMILLMAGSNGLNIGDRDILIKTILKNFKGELFVATIPPQKAPRAGWKSVGKYNQSLVKAIKKLKAKHKNIFLVDIYSAMNSSDILKDGVHPNQRGNAKIAYMWYQAINEKSKLIKKHLQQKAK